MAIAIAIPFPRAAERVRRDRPRRAVPIAAQPGARVYSPYGRQRLTGPMAVPRAGAGEGAAALRATGGRLRRPFSRPPRG
ncbi:MAG TPA: hypothetical protein VIM50_06470 [Candidatus Limnocylindria bacterium]|jgi:hypothetical protein